MSDYKSASLDELPLFARATDPETSHVSAPSLTKAARQANQLLEAIRELSATGDAPTALEAGAFASKRHGGHAGNIRKRLDILTGMDPCPIKQVGKRKCKEGTGTARTWRAVQ